MVRALLMGADPRAVLAGVLLTTGLGGATGAMLAERRRVSVDAQVDAAPTLIVETTARRAKPAPMEPPEAPAPEAASRSSRNTPPRPEPAPTLTAPAPEAGARVQVEGDATEVTLVGESGSVTLPGRVSPGRWRVRARFPGLEGEGAGSLEITDEETITLRCEARFARCARLP